MHFIGLDLGQKRDYSAVVVVERIEHRRAFQATAFDRLLVRWVERMALGTPYPAVVERMREIVRSDELCGDCVLVVDATGVGAPVVDMLRAARLGCEVMAVTMTGGGREHGGSVPKRDLLAGVEVLLEKGQLRIGRVREASRLGRELMAMRTGKDGGEHDDLVIALALACWRAQGRRTNGEGTRRLL